MVKRKEWRWQGCFNPADILILDEPTDHLDGEMVIWLEDFLPEFSWDGDHGHS